MLFHPIRWTSLRTRITLGTVSIFLASVWFLAWHTASRSRTDLEREIGNQQLAQANTLAQQLQAGFDSRLHALQLVSSGISPTELAQPAALMRLLEQRPLLREMFDGGVAVINAKGRTLASTHANGVPAADDPAIQTALTQATNGIGFLPADATPGSLARIIMVTPILDDEGRIGGAIAAVLLLHSHSFLEAALRPADALSGSVFIVEPMQRHIIATTSADANRQKASQPKPAISLEGWQPGREGTQVHANAVGQTFLSAHKRLSQPAWDLVVMRPTEQVFAPIAKLQERLWISAGLATVLALLVGVPLLRREFRPIHAAVQALNDMNAGSQPQRPLPIAHDDEIGDLVTAFNQLLRTLTQRESLLRDVFDTSSVGIFLVDTGSRITQANQRMAELFDRPLDQLLGLEYAELVDPSERDLGRVRTFALMSAKIDTVDIDRLYARADGSTFWGRLTGRRIYDADGTLLGLVGVIADISDRRLTQQVDRFRSQALELLARGDRLDTILLHVVQGVEELIPDSIASCVLLSDDGKALGKSVAPHLPSEYCQSLVGLPIGPTAGSCGAAAFSGQRVVVQDIATHPNWEPYRELAQQAGLRACWSQPILGETGRVLGTFAVYHRTPHSPTDTHINILEQAAQLASVAIERSRVALQLRESEEHFRLLTEGVSDVVWRQDKYNVFTYISPADERMRGFPADQVVGHHVSEMMTPRSMETIRRRAAERTLVRDNSIAANTLTFQLEQKCKDGSTIWTEVKSTAERDANGAITGYRGITRDITDRLRAQTQLQLAASVFSHAQEGIMITAPDGAILEVNTAFSDITGYAREEVLGHNPRLLKSHRHERQFYESMYSVLLEQGRWHGEIWNRRKDGAVYPQTTTINAVRDDSGTTQHYVCLFTDITALKEQQQRLEHVAHFDALTHLPNRVLLADRLHQAMAQTQRRNQALAVVFLDLDGFKAVNDQHGHAVGDELLIALAARMRAVLRDGDTLARLGGDEFVGVLIDVPNLSACEPLLMRLLKAASDPVPTSKGAQQVSASLGITFYPQPDHADVDADQLMRQADQAMYQAKLAGKDRFHVFDAQYDRQLHAQQESQERGRQALRDGELVLHYQPKVHMRTGELLGVEALLRWRHPEKGVLPPAAFLPVIEGTLVDLEIGQWVLQTVMEQIADWHQQGFDPKVSVNISAHQLQAPKFAVVLDTILQTYGETLAGRLELEVQESSALQDVYHVSKAMQACIQLGVRFVLDDFGTGYSSLSYLKQLPVRQLKIDQSFVRNMLEDPEDLAVLDAIIGMANAFHRTVVAEGVETLEHGRLLLQLGCTAAQGYCIAHPMPPEALPGWVRQWRVPARWASTAVVSRDKYSTLYAAIELRAWVRAVENHVKGLVPSPPTLDSSHCHLGRWLHGEGARSLVDKETFRRLDSLHEQLHAIAQELCAAPRVTGAAQAHTLAQPTQLMQLHAVSNALLDALDACLAAPLSDTATTSVAAA